MMRRNARDPILILTLHLIPVYFHHEFASSCGLHGRVPVPPEKRFLININYSWRTRLFTKSVDSLGNNLPSVHASSA